MADGTHIEWTDATWNPVTGCSVVSPGCTNCYAMKLAGTRLRTHASRKGLTRATKAGPVWTGEVRFNAEWLTQPLSWKRPRKVFVCAHGDLFAEGVPDAWIDQVFAVMALAPQHQFQVLTKRPERMRAYLLEQWQPAPAQTYTIGGDTFDMPAESEGETRRDQVEREANDIGESNGLIDIDKEDHWTAEGDAKPLKFAWPLHNVWLGTSIEDQKRADERVPHLLATPAAVRFVSVEPMLGPVDLRGFVRPWSGGGRRDWASWQWPEWVPAGVRQQIESFWQASYGRGPCDWIRGGLANGQPPLGTRGRYRLCTEAAEYVEGRFVPAWNNIGRVIDDAGAAHVVSAGAYQSRQPVLDWVIVGGESGDGARPMHPDWARALRDQCAAAGVPFFFKQWGSWSEPLDGEEYDTGKGRLASPAAFIVSRADGTVHCFDNKQIRDGVVMIGRGKKAAGRLLDGVEHNGMPGVAA